nr:hypothetical protein [Tanacetum cinerariifolium]
MSFSKRSDSDAVCYTNPLDSLKHWNDHFFWVDSFACPASFPWHTGKNVSRDPFPKSTEFNADDYAIIVARPASFRKFPEPFLCLIGMSRNYTLDEDTYRTFLHDDGTGGCFLTYIVQLVADPIKVKVGEPKCAEGEARLLDFIVGRVVPLLPVAPARAKSELEDSVEKLFDEGGSADQVDSAAGGGQEAEVGITTSEAAICGKSSSALRKLLESSMLNVEVGVAAVPTLHMVTSLVSVTPEHESDAPADSITGPNVRTVGASESFGDGCQGYFSLRASLFQNSDSMETVKADIMGPSYSAKKDLSMGSRELNSETLRQVFVSQWNVLNDSLLDDYDVSHEFVDHLAPPALFSQIREMNIIICS